MCKFEESLVYHVIHVSLNSMDFHR